MTPIDIKRYLSEKKRATLSDIAVHFRLETGAAVPMLDLWIRKGKIEKHQGHQGCRKKCCNCDAESTVTYEWIA